MPCNLNVTGSGILSVTTPRNGFQWGGRVDQVLGPKDRLYGSIYRTSVEQILGGTPSAWGNAFTSPEPEYTLYAHINETHIFTPTVLNEFGASFIRLHGSIPCETCSVPSLAVSGISTFGDPNGPLQFIQNNFEYRDNLSWDRGAHSFRFGVDRMKLQSNFKPVQAYTRPQFTFLNALYLAADQPYSESNIGFNPTTGNPFVPDVAERQPFWGVFAQDTWKLRKNFTLNLGLRWETFGKVSEATEVTNLVLPSAGNFETRIASATSQVVPYILRNLRLGNIGPRVGIAWDPMNNGKLSVRAGFGRFYDAYTAQVYGGSHFNPPLYALGTACVCTPATLPVFAMGTSNTYPFGFPYPAIQLGLNSQNGLASTQVGISATDPNLPTAYTQNWFFGVQYALTHNWIFESDYIGTEGHHLYASYDVNRFDGDLILNNNVLTRINHSFGAIGYAQANLNSFYTGSTFSIKNRGSHGLTMQLAYTLGKAIDDESSFGANLNVVDAADVQRERGRSDYDVRTKVAFSVVWQLPRPGTRSALVNHTFGGWELSDVTILQSGTPFTVYCSSPFNPVRNAAGQIVGNSGCDYNADGFDYDVPNAPAFAAQSYSRQQWLNGVFAASDFPTPALGQEGNLGRNTYTGPGFANSDVSLSRNFGMPWFAGERSNLQFRAEIFNAFNRVNLTSVISDTSSVLFGKATATYGARDIQLGLRFSF